MVKKNHALAEMDRQIKHLDRLARKLRKEKRTQHRDCLFCPDHAFSAPEWPLWLLRSGLSDESHQPVSRSGLYTDFT